MKAVITGDVVNSKSTSTKDWLSTLEMVLKSSGKSPQDWEIYRGDSFQLMLNAEDAIAKALHIKAVIKQFEELDVRLGIGIGEIDFLSDKITTSNGTAFVRSGECFEALKKQNMLLFSGEADFDQIINTMLGLALYIANRWTTTVSNVIKTALEHPELKQQELAKRLKKSQSNISEALKRGGYDEIMAMNAYYKSEILKR
jgi:hypothetical protein